MVLYCVWLKLCRDCVLKEKSKEKKVVPGRKDEEKMRKKLAITETSVSTATIISCAQPTAMHRVHTQQNTVIL